AAISTSENLGSAKQKNKQRVGMWCMEGQALQAVEMHKAKGTGSQGLTERKGMGIRKKE
ncbi:hypothetical protein GOP47_0031114, partial [Adiantum capillus-veneris]